MAQFCTHCRRRLGAAAVCSCAESRRPSSVLTAARPATVSVLHQRLDLTQRVAARKRLLTLTAIGGLSVVVVLLGLLVVFADSRSAVSASPVAAERPAGATRAGTPSGSGTSPDRALEEQRDADRPALSGAVGSWLPQVSSKRPGVTVDGVTWSVERIWEDFRTTQQQHADARLVWSDDWTSFRRGGYWVTVIDRRYSSASQANAWCDAQGFPADQCYAKRLMRSGGFEGNTVPRG